MGESESLLELARRSVLPSDLLTKWLVELEERLRKIEDSRSSNVTWGVGQDELAETKRENAE